VAQTDASDTFVEWVYETFGSVNRPSANEFVVDCPLCGAKKRLSLNPVKGVSNCYSCGGRRLIHLMKEVTGLNSFACEAIVKGGEDVTIAGGTGILDQLTARAPGPNPLTLAKRAELEGEIKRYFKPVGHGDQFVDITAGQYLAKRGYNLDRAADWRLYFAVGGKYARRIILPVFENGYMVYFQGRSISNDDRLRYLNPSADDGMPGDAAVFNLDVAAQYGGAVPVYIFEGAFNAMAVGSNAIALFKKTMTDEQYYKICSTLTRNTELVICLDHGAEVEAARIGQKLAAAGYPTSVVLPPTDDDYNDTYIAFGDDGVRELLTDHRATIGGASSVLTILGR